MKALPIRFSETARLRVEDTAETLKLNPSVVARAALRIGLQKILAVSSKDITEAQALAMMEDLNARQ